MGLVRAAFELANPSQLQLQPVQAHALVDTGAVPYVGPVDVRFANRRCFTGAMVLGDEVLVGAIPLEDMDLLVRSQLQTVTVNPESPNLPVPLAQSLRAPAARAVV